MIDYELVSSIFEDIEKIERPLFEEEEEKICWLVEQTWKLAQKAEQEFCMGICDEAAEDMTNMAKWGAQTCSKLIKARGQE